MLFSYIAYYGFIKFVACDFYGFVYDYASERKNGNVSRTSANIYDHASIWSAYIYTGAYRRRYRLFDQICLPCSRFLGCFYQRALLDFSDA